MADVRKWSYNDIVIKLENLKKIIDPYEIEHQIRIGKSYTDDITDALNIAYYNLKKKYLKIQMNKFGYIRPVTYIPRQREYYNYYSNYNSTWTISTNSSGYWGF